MTNIQHLDFAAQAGSLRQVQILASSSLSMQNSRADAHTHTQGMCAPTLHVTLSGRRRWNCQPSASTVSKRFTFFYTALSLVHLGEATNSFISSCMICMTFDIRTVKDESLLSVMSHKQHAF